MKHRKFSVLYGAIYMETHNHDSKGERLGYLADGVDMKQIRAFIEAMPEELPKTGKPLRRIDHMKNELKKAGLLKILTAFDMGRIGGSVSSEAKRKAVRENGKLGGRPKKEK